MADTAGLLTDLSVRNKTNEKTKALRLARLERLEMHAFECGGLFHSVARAVKSF